MRLLTSAVTFLLLLLSLPSHASSIQSANVNTHPTSVLEPNLTADSPFTRLGITSESIAKAYSNEFEKPVFWFDRPWQETRLLQSNGNLSLQSQSTIRPYMQQRRLISTPTLSASVSISYAPSLGICCTLSESLGFSATSTDAQPNTNLFNQFAPFTTPLSSNSAKLIPSSAHLALLTNNGVPVNLKQMHQHVAAAGKSGNFNWYVSSTLDQYNSTSASLSNNLQQAQYWTNEAQGRWSTEAVELTIGIEFARFDQRQRSVENNCQSDSCETNSQTLRGSVQLAYELKQGLDTYVAISRGENAGFKFTNALSAAPLELLPSTNYRLGLSNAFMDNTLSINTALYYSNPDRSNFNSHVNNYLDNYLDNDLGSHPDNLLADYYGNTTRLSTSDTSHPFTRNDSLIKTQGFEVEGLYTMTDAIRFSLGISYTDPIYSADNTRTQLEQELSPLWQGSASVLVANNLPGTKWQYLVNLNFTHVGQASNESSFNPTHSSSMMSVVSSQVGIRSPNSRYNLLVWSQNMDDENITSDTGSTDLRNIQQTPKSSYGITFTAILGN